MNNIIAKTNAFIEQDIYKDSILNTIIDKMISNNNFDFFSTCAIYMQNPDIDILFPEHYIDSLGYKIDSIAKPILVPLPNIYSYFLKDGRYINIKHSTLSDKEKILNKTLEVKDEYTYNLYVFYDIQDTNQDCTNNFFNTHINLNLDIMLKTVTLLCEKSGLTIQIEPMEVLELKSLFDKTKNIIFVDEKLNIKDKSFEILKAYLSLLFEKTSTQISEISTFELDICLYILSQYLYINHPFPSITGNINMNNSINRCFKITKFIVDKLLEFEPIILEEIENENIPDDETTKTSTFRNIKGGKR